MKILMIIALFLLKIIFKFRLWPLAGYIVLMTTTLRDWEQANPTLAICGFGVVAALIVASWVLTILKNVRGGVQS